MKTYTTVDDFLQDRSFVRWVLNPDSPTSSHWEKIANDKGTAILLRQSRLILLELDLPGNDWEVQDQLTLLSKIHQRIQIKNSHTPIACKDTNTYRSNFRKKASYVLFLVFFSFIAFLAFDIVKTEKVEVVEKVEAEWITKFNPKGQKSKIHLPDGSTVIINAESEIKFRSDFGETNRQVYLKGESFFEVAPDSLLPFQVFSGTLITTALGTSFNINSYDSENIQVQLATGKVEVMSDSQEFVPIFLKPGEELRVIGNQNLKKRKFNPKKAFLWKSGILLFDNVSLSEFKMILERWYGVDISLINPPSKKLEISGEFKDIYLTNVLETIGYAYGFDYKIDQKTVKLVFTP
ncbi:MAG TPA: FecR domain-containing protein [Lunatimonas sp.]|nr:FecR domain-containing protein [Lunatimonas sp.]